MKSASQTEVGDGARNVDTTWRSTSSEGATTMCRFANPAVVALTAKNAVIALTAKNETGNFFYLSTQCVLQTRKLISDWVIRCGQFHSQRGESQSKN